MAAFNRPTEATYTVHEHVTVDTNDREDHTFCGIMFPVKCKQVLPVKELIINTIAVRGRLGPLTVWVTNEENEILPPPSSSHSTPSIAAAAAAPEEAAASSSTTSRRWFNLRRSSRHSTSSSTATTTAAASAPEKNIGTISLKQENWTKVYERTHGPSFHTYCDLDLSSNPIKVKPGQVRGIYIHSTLEGDEAIVYDNKTNLKTQDDKFLTVLPGRAHVSTEAFGKVSIWGWGHPWRDNREFVGRISYGVVYKLWNPREHLTFGRNFRELTTTLFACQRRLESPVSMLPDDVIYYILNMCRWDWVKDSYDESLKDRKKINNSKRRLFERQREEARARMQLENDESVARAQEAEAAVAQKTSGMKRQSTHSTADVESDESTSDDEYEESDDSDGGEYTYGDHRSSNSFRFTCYDECADSDEEEAAEIEHHQEQTRRRHWLMQHLSRRGIIRVLHDYEDSSEEEEDDDNEEVEEQE